MDPKLEKPSWLLVNPFALWADFALKAGQAMWASAHAAAVRSNAAPKVGVIPTADAPATSAPRVEAQGAAKPAARPAAGSPRKARTTARHASSSARPKTKRAKPRSKVNAKRRARR